MIYDVSDARRGDADCFDKLCVVADGRDDATAAAFKKFLLDRDLRAALRFRSCSSHHQTIASVELSALRSLMPLGVGEK